MFLKKWCIFFLIPISLAAKINSNGDFQFWQWNFIRKNLDEHWDLFTTTQIRFGDNASKLYYSFLQQQVMYIPAVWVAFAPGYRQAVRRFPIESSRWILEYIPFGDLIFLVKPGGWEIADRNRIEYRISKGTRFPWLYRNRLRAYLPCHWTKMELTPFVDTEFFWREGDGITESRSSLGLREYYSEHIGSEIFYMLRFLKGVSDWTYQNVLNISLIFNY